MVGSLEWRVVGSGGGGVRCLGDQDQQLRYQQNLDRHKIAVLVLPYANWIKLQPHAAAIAAAVSALRAGSYVELDLK
jgi:hypothetical protein